MNIVGALVLALLVAGCGGQPPATSAPPAPSVIAVPTATALTRRPTPVPVDLATCEIAIRTADHLEDVLLNLVDAIGNADEMDRLVDQTTDLAEQQAEFMADVTHPTFVGWAGILRQIDEATVPHLTGDDAPFIEAVGRGAAYANDLKAACS